MRDASSLVGEIQFGSRLHMLLVFKKHILKSQRNQNKISRIRLHIMCSDCHFVENRIFCVSTHAIKNVILS